MLFKEEDSRLMLTCTVGINKKESFLVWFTKLLTNFLNMGDKDSFDPIMLDFIINKAIILSREAEELLNFREKWRKVFEG